jgi:hypothetical protein
MIRLANRLNGSGHSPRQQASALLAALLLAVLQVVAVSHLVGHSASGDADGCELCLNAAHGGHGLAATATVPPVFLALLGRVTFAPTLRVSSRAPTTCRARGPPSFA